MSSSRVGETLGHLSAAGGSLARSRSQSALALTALAGIAAMSPAAAIGCGLAGLALLAVRPVAVRPALGAPRHGPFLPKGGRGATFAVAIDEDGQEIRIGAEAMRGGVLIAGADRRSRVGAILRLAEEALANASGLVLVDNGGDDGFRDTVWDLARRYGREDDVLCLDLRWPGRDLGNSFDPFATASRDRIVAILVAMMDEAGGDGAMWRGRAIALLTAVISIECWLREAHGRPVSIKSILQALNLRRVIGALDAHPDMPDDVRFGVTSYLGSLPGYREERGERQPQTTMDQHGYLEMQFTKILSDMAHCFGEGGGVRVPDVDFADVVRGRRILLVRYPSWSHNLEYACKLVLSTLKQTLHEQADQDKDHRPSPGSAPFLVMQDEAGEYVLPGLAALVPKAPSLNLSMIYATQAMPELGRMSEKEAASIIANTNVRIFMRTEEMGEPPGPDMHPKMRRLETREAASIIPSTNTKIFMRTEEMETGYGGRSMPVDVVTGPVPVLGSVRPYQPTRSASGGRLNRLLAPRVGANGR